jgi:hypothetical protein
MKQKEIEKIETEKLKINQVKKKINEGIKNIDYKNENYAVIILRIQKDGKAETGFTHNLFPDQLDYLLSILNQHVNKIKNGK